MGRRRPGSTPEERRRQAEEEQSSPEAVAAAGVAALLLAGSSSATVPAVAALLLPALASVALIAPATVIAAEAAELVLKDPPRFNAAGGNFERRAGLENLLVRGLYGVAAAKRLSKAFTGLAGTDTAERLAKALRAERRHFSDHVDARARNVEAAKKTDQARELYGDRVSWNHGARRLPAEPRPNHLRADGRVWDLRRGIPVSTGALPGVLPFCTCEWGPPRRGAALLT